MTLDVIVVGGGLSGLRCAEILAERGASVKVLEARDRVGGRTLSQSIGGSTFDLGGQWIGPTQDRLAERVKHYGIQTFSTFHQGDKVLELNGALSRYPGTIPRLPPWSLFELERSIRSAEARARAINPLAPLSSPDALLHDTRTVEDFLRSASYSRRARQVFTAAIKVVFGCEPSEISLLHCLFYARAGGSLMRLVEIENGAQQDRFVSGAQSVSKAIAAHLGDRVVLAAPVRKVVQETSRVVVHSDAGVFEARRVVLAVPPGLAYRMNFEPALPPKKALWLQRFVMGATVKCLAFYDRPFWRDAGLSGELVVRPGAVSVVFDNTSHDGKTACLLAFIVGEEARGWSERPEKDRREEVLQTFARAFGPKALQTTHYQEQDWSTERWSGGCPVAAPPPGTWSTVGDLLCTPVGRIHFAGTETARVWNGYMEGALEAAERAASEVMAT